VVAGPPTGPVALPAALVEYAGARAVWQNELGGITFDAGDRFVKWNPWTTGISLDDEVVRLAWAAAWHPVPAILEVGSDATGEWLVTAAIDARSAILSTQPSLAAFEIGRGLRRLHDELPVDECPWDWSVESRMRPGLSLGAVPSIDRLVVCHGDACAPNTLLDANGQFAASVDLGSLGTADRWADLAVGSMSLEWNFGPGFDREYFAGYGVAPDAERIAFYRALWNSED
jgi:kanamycin kinase